MVRGDVPSLAVGNDGQFVSGQIDEHAIAAKNRWRKDVVMGLMDRVRQLAGKNPQKAEQGIDKIAQQADERTGGKRSEQITKGAEQVKNRLGLGGQTDDQDGPKQP